jgi:hypothetical protein
MKGINMSYKSPEQKAADVLIPLGCIHQNDKIMPYSFIDKDGTQFEAKADFYHPSLDLYIEIKDSHLNGKTTKTKARKAYDRIDPYRLRQSPTFHQTRNQWNHAAPKQAIVQSVIGAAQFAILFIGQPDQETLGRIFTQGIHSYSLARFATMLELQLSMPMASQ